MSIKTEALYRGFIGFLAGLVITGISLKFGYTVLTWEYWIITIPVCLLTGIFIGTYKVKP